MNVAVFLKEGHGHPLSLEKGKITSAGEVKMMMLDELNIPKTSSHVFSIWFISPHLGMFVFLFEPFFFNIESIDQPNLNHVLFTFGNDNVSRKTSPRHLARHWELFICEVAYQVLRYQKFFKDFPSTVFLFL